MKLLRLRAVFFMDSFTQIVLGASIAHVTLPKKLGKHRLWMGALFGTLPDLDVWLAPLLYKENPLAEVQFHRGFSHSIAFFVCISLLFSYIFQKKFSAHVITYKQWFISVFMVLITHSLLDVFTTWGTQLFWPLPYKLDLHSIFVVDPLYTLPLFLGLIFYYRKQKIKWIYFGIISSSIYLLIGLGIQYFVTQKIIEDSQLDHVNVTKITVKPTAFNSILWNVIIETSDSFLINQYSLNDTFIEEFKQYPKRHELFSKIPLNLQIQLKEITQNQFTVEFIDGKYIVNDLRFGLLKDDPKEIQFAFSYVVNQTNGEWVVYEQEKQKRDGKALFMKIFNRIKGN